MTPPGGHKTRGSTKSSERARCDRSGLSEEPKADRVDSALPMSNGRIDAVEQAEGTRLEKVQAIRDPHQSGTQNGGMAGTEFFGGERDLGSETSSVRYKFDNGIQCSTSKGFDPVNQWDDEADTGNRNRETHFVREIG